MIKPMPNLKRTAVIEVDREKPDAAVIEARIATGFEIVTLADVRLGVGAPVQHRGTAVPVARASNQTKGENK
jgi:hypothetical protein